MNGLKAIHPWTTGKETSFRPDILYATEKLGRLSLCLLLIIPVGSMGILFDLIPIIVKRLDFRFFFCSAAWLIVLLFYRTEAGWLHNKNLSVLKHVPSVYNCRSYSPLFLTCRWLIRVHLRVVSVCYPSPEPPSNQTNCVIGTTSIKRGCHIVKQVF